MLILLLNRRTPFFGLAPVAISDDREGQKKQARRSLSTGLGRKTALALKNHLAHLFKTHGRDDRTEAAARTAKPRLMRLRFGLGSIKRVW